MGMTILDPCISLKSVQNSKGGMMSEDIGQFLHLQKIFRKTILNYPIQYMAMINYWKNLIDCMLLMLQL